MQLSYNMTNDYHQISCNTKIHTIWKPDLINAIMQLISQENILKKKKMSLRCHLKPACQQYTLTVLPQHTKTVRCLYQKTMYNHPSIGGQIQLSQTHQIPSWFLTRTVIQCKSKFCVVTVFMYIKHKTYDNTQHKKHE